MAANKSFYKENGVVKTETTDMNKTMVTPKEEANLSSSSMDRRMNGKTKMSANRMSKTETREYQARKD